MNLKGIQVPPGDMEDTGQVPPSPQRTPRRATTPVSALETEISQLMVFRERETWRRLREGGERKRESRNPVVLLSVQYKSENCVWEWMGGWVDGWTGGQMGGCMDDGWVYGRTNRWTDE
jgi:hypothetical protein